MKSKGRIKRRRYSGRKRNQIVHSRIGILLIVLFLISVVCGSVFLGKYLKKKAEISEIEREYRETEADVSSESSETEAKDILLQARPPEKLVSRYLSLDSEQTVLPENTASVTLVMRDTAGTLYYSSAVAQAMGLQSAENGMKTSEEILSELDDVGIYTSVYIGHSPHENGESGVTGALHAYDSALAEELALAGADEIIFCGIDYVDAVKAEALCSLSMSIRETGEKAVALGLLLPYSFFEGEGAREICGKLYEYYEIIAVDYTDTSGSEEKTYSEVISERIDNMQMYFSRFGVRVLLDADNPEYEDGENTVLERAVYSVQAVSRAALNTSESE